MARFGVNAVLDAVREAYARCDVVFILKPIIRDSEFEVRYAVIADMIKFYDSILIGNPDFVVHASGVNIGDFFDAIVGGQLFHRDNAFDAAVPAYIRCEVAAGVADVINVVIEAFDDYLAELIGTDIFHSNSSFRVVVLDSYRFAY